MVEAGRALWPCPTLWALPQPSLAPQQPPMPTLEAAGCQRRHESGRSWTKSGPGRFLLKPPFQEAMSSASLTLG